MNRFVCLFFCLLFFVSFAFAGIINVVVPSEVPLNMDVSATGVVLDDSNVSLPSQKCCFYFLEAESGYLVDRATDQFTDSIGRFALSKFRLNEPDFVRGREYTLKTICGDYEFDANFLVVQKQDAFGWGDFRFFPQAVGYDLLYWTNADYIYALMYGFVFLAIVIFMFKKMFF